MPELPEVETVRRTLEEMAAGRIIIGTKLNMEKIVKMPEIKEFCRHIIGKTIVKVDRKGKYLLVRMSEAYTMVVHLRMTGQLIYCSKERDLEKHTHVILDLDNGDQLRYIDPRQFGTIHLLPNDELDKISGLRTLGPEPIKEEFTLEGFTKALANKKTKIKGLLLDQTFIAGLGNIYCDEALFRAGIHPERIAGSLTPEEIGLLFTAVREVLLDGIKHRGTSLKDYVDAYGNKGGFQHHLKAYGRVSQPCLNCGSEILRKKVAGRSSFYCPNCQKEGQA
jgi:formamidopyrimidine-DNA glycosylase